jgi:hypothetical protein
MRATERPMHEIELIDGPLAGKTIRVDRVSSAYLVPLAMGPNDYAPEPYPAPEGYTALDVALYSHDHANRFAFQGMRS